MSKYWITPLVIALGLVGTSSAVAKDTGPFFGLGVGQSNLESGPTGITGLEFEADDIGYKVFGGWRVLKNFAVEASYFDYGSLDDQVLGVNVGTNLTGFNAYALGFLTLGPVDVFGKAGMVFWDVEADAMGVSTEDDGNDMAYGVGVGATLGSFGIRGEWEQFDIEDTDDVSMISVSFTMTF